MHTKPCLRTVDEEACIYESTLIEEPDSQIVITSCDVCTNHWDAVVHMETFDSDTQVGRMLTKWNF